MSFLDQYDNAAGDAKFPLVRGWMKNSPLEFFAELRENRPILKTPECTLLALHDDVVDALLQPSVFTVQLYEDKMGTYLMAQDDTPVHFREKAVMQSLLNRDDLPRIRQFVGKTASGALDAAPDQKIEAINGLTRRVPIALVQEYMGFDGVPPQNLARWSLFNQWDTFHNQPFDGNGNAAEIHAKTQAVNEELRAYLAELVPRRIEAIKGGDQRDDIVSRLLRVSLPRYIGEVMVPEIVRQVVLRPKARPLSAIEYGEASFPERYMIAIN